MNPSLRLLLSLGLAAPIAPALAAQQTLIQEVEGQLAGEEFGQSVAGGQDVDGDGVPDVVVGSPRDDFASQDAGKVTVFSGADDSVLHVWYGTGLRAQLGISVALLPDLDGDQCAEVVTGEYFQAAPSSAGIVHVYSGKTGAVIHQWVGAAGVFFGWSVDDAGDLDGDGHHDVAVGSYLDSTVVGYGGAVHLYSGGSGNLIRSHYGSTNTGFFGQGVGTGHDLTGDGVPDYAIGSPLDGLGRVDVFSGANGALVHTLVAATGNQFGRFVELSEDVTGDGLAEIMVSSPNGGPAVRVFSGADKSLVHTFTGSGIGGNFGWSIAAPGDTDGDGVADFVVGADAYSSATGLFEVYSGVDGAPIHRLYGWDRGTAFGRAIEPVGDVDGDGRADLAVSATIPSSSASLPGRVRIVSGACLGTAIPYGSGLAGSGGFVPQLAATGCPVPNADFGIELSALRGGSTGQLILGFQPASLSAFGGKILVLPPWIRTPLYIPGSGDGNGSLALSVRLSDDPNLVGFSFQLQFLGYDSGAPVGISMTNGLSVTIR